MIRYFLVAPLFFLCVHGQLNVWDATQQIWCTDFRRITYLVSSMIEPCNNMRVCFIHNCTQMVRGCCFPQAAVIVFNRICSGWKTSNSGSQLKIDVTSCQNSILSTELNGNQTRVCC